MNPIKTARQSRTVAETVGGWRLQR